MNFSEKKGKYYYGYVKGTSMWPELIPGDILRAEMVTAEKVSPGDIVVFAYKSNNPVVHRLIAIDTQINNSLLLFSAGDRSGEDPPTVIQMEEKLLRIRNILRNGFWKKPGRKSFPLSSKLPNFIIKLYCKLIRKLFW